MQQTASYVQAKKESELPLHSDQQNLHPLCLFFQIAYSPVTVLLTLSSFQRGKDLEI